MDRTTTPPLDTPRSHPTRGSRRPVLLATLAPSVDPSAERMAIDSALEANRSLLLVNAVARPPAPSTVARFPEAVMATANRAMALGVRTELLPPVSPSPAKTIVLLANERRAALVVLGRPRGFLRRWRFRRAARAIRRDTSCLVWIAPG